MTGISHTIHRPPRKGWLGIIANLLLAAVAVQCALAQANFIHPSVGFNLADLQRMKTNITIDPWKSGFNAFTNQFGCVLNYVMQGPFGSVTRNNTGINTNEAAFDADIGAACDQALMWNATGNTNYAVKATSILTAWFTTLTNWISSDGTVGIEVSEAGSSGAEAAEIMRYTYPGWTSNDTYICASFFTNMVWNWIQTNGYGTGNQGMSKINGMTAVSIFCDSTNWFSITTNVFMADECASLTNDSLPSGQNAEEGRDQGHPLGSIGSQLGIADMCWEATGGGVNFYSYLTNRILLEMEYYSDYNMGGTVPYQTYGPCTGSYSSISTGSRGAEDARYQLMNVKAWYVNQLGQSAPYSMAYLNWFSADQNDFFYENSTFPFTPDAPSLPAALQGYKEVTLSWPSALGSKSYNVLRSTTNGGPYTIIASSVPGPAFVNAGLTNGVTYFYAVTATGSGGTSTNSVPVSGQPQTLGLVDADVGSVGTPGNATFSAGTWTVQGAGSDIGGGSDGGNYAYQNLIGDGEIVARLASATWISGMGKIGVMMRGSTNADDVEVSLVFDDQFSTPRMFDRESDGSTDTYNASAVTSGSVPLWLRLKRAGNSFTSYTSTDGTNWAYLSTAIVVMANTIDVGLFVCSRGSSLETGNFDNVTMPALSAPPPPSGLIATGGSGQVALSWATDSGATGYNVGRSLASGGPYTIISTNQIVTSYLDTNVVNNTTYYYVVSAVNVAGASPNSAEVSALTGLPAPWTDEDVGSPSPAGNATFSSGGAVFTVEGSGGDVGGTGDSFNFMYLSLTNNGTIIARLASTAWGASSLGKIGLMMRESTNSGSVDAWVFLDNGSSDTLRMGYRTSTGGSESYTGSGPANITPPEWLMLQRVGNTLTTFYSSNGVAWTALGTNIFGSFANPCLAGLAVCSRTSALATGTFENLSVPGFAPPAPPSSLTAAPVSNDEIDLDWPPSSAATSYQVFRSSTNGGPYTLIASNLVSTSYNDVGIGGGTTNYYVVTAGDIAGVSTNSPQASGVTIPLPPASLTATGGVNQVWLRWPGSFGAASYNLYRSTINDASYLPVVYGLTTTNCTDTSVLGSQTYFYVVSAVNLSGESGYSIQASATPTPSVSPVQVSLHPTGNQLQFTWPPDHIGWTLQTQTNAAGSGLGTNWAFVSGSSTTNQVTIPVNGNNGNVFFRLAYP